jgi:ATP-dependent DNA helicase RecG
LVRITGLSRRGIEWNMVKLKAAGIIERIGGKKEGYWKINEEKIVE